MNEDFEDIEDEMDALEEEEKVEKKKASPKKETKEVEDEEPEITERYIPVYQEQIIGIADTVSGNMVVQGLDSLAIAKLEAIKLNQLDKMATISGVA